MYLFEELGVLTVVVLVRGLDILFSWLAEVEGLVVLILWVGLAAVVLVLFCSEIPVVPVRSVTGSVVLVLVPS